MERRRTCGTGTVAMSELNREKREEKARVGARSFSYCLPYMSPEAGPIHRKDGTIDPGDLDLASVHANHRITRFLYV